MVERIFHIIAPMAVRIMPAMGSSGIAGQRRISIRLAIPPMTITNVPTRSKIRREMNPTQREIRRSISMRNLTSSEAVPEAISAEI